MSDEAEVRHRLLASTRVGIGGATVVERGADRYALARWPLARGKSTSAPFTGIGFSFPGCERGATDDEAARLEAPLNTIEQDLADFSRRWPGLTFVWMEADCSGGTWQRLHGRAYS